MNKQEFTAQFNTAADPIVTARLSSQQDPASSSSAYHRSIGTAKNGETDRRRKVPDFDLRLLNQQQLLARESVIPDTGQATFKCQKPANQQALLSRRSQIPSALQQPAQSANSTNKYGTISFKFEVYRKDKNANQTDSSNNFEGSLHEHASR